MRKYVGENALQYLISKVKEAIATALPLKGGTMSGEIKMGTNKVSGLGTPTADTDAATKGYVDGAIKGGTAASAGTATKLAKAQAITLTGPVTGTANFDGSAAASIATTITATGVVADTYGPTEIAENKQTLAFGGTFSVPAVTVNDAGQTTAASTIVFTLPAAPTSVSGNAATASKLATAQAITLTGPVTGTANFDGSAAASIGTTITATGVAADTYGPTEIEGDAQTLAFGGTFAVPSVTVNAAGQATGASTITFTLPAAPTSVSGNAATATKLAKAQAITLTGPVTGTANFDGSAAASIATTITATGVTAAAYGPAEAATLAFGKTFTVPYVTVNAAGQVTKAATTTLTMPAAPSTSDNTKLPLAGGTMTGNIVFKGNALGIRHMSAIEGDAGRNAITFFSGESTSGSGMVIGAGGLTIIGGGEAAATMYNAVTAGDSPTNNAVDEYLWLASDQTINIYTGCQTIANRKKITIETDGTISLTDNQTPAKDASVTSKKYVDSHDLKKFTGSIAIAGWNSSTKKATLSNAAILASTAQGCFPCASDEASTNQIVQHGVVPVAQAAGSITFLCTSIPTAAINLTVYYVNI